jgi:hypothetical protein
VEKPQSLANHCTASRFSAAEPKASSIAGFTPLRPIMTNSAQGNCRSHLGMHAYKRPGHPHVGHGAVLLCRLSAQGNGSPETNIHDCVVLLECAKLRVYPGSRVYLAYLDCQYLSWRLVRLKPCKSALSTVRIPRDGQTGVTESLLGGSSEAFRGGSMCSK